MKVLSFTSEKVQLSLISFFVRLVSFYIVFHKFAVGACNKIVLVSCSSVISCWSIWPSVQSLYFRRSVVRNICIIQTSAMKYFPNWMLLFYSLCYLTLMNCPYTFVCTHFKDWRFLLVILIIYTFWRACALKSLLGSSPFLLL